LGPNGLGTVLAMDRNRRYTEDEVREILDRATEAPSPASPGTSHAEGLTLKELHDIGQEVGIPKELITRAASGLDRANTDFAPRRQFLGTPIGVGRTVCLSRPLADDEWNRLVVDLRETFDARGKLREEGVFRQWTNSNLQALLEPTEGGARLRLKTLKGNGQASLGVGAAMFAASSGAYALSLLSGAAVVVDPGNAIVLGTVGALLYLSARIRLPKWAIQREEQMEGVIARLTASVEDRVDAGPGEAP
jgi:hypothetical protein